MAFTFSRRDFMKYTALAAAAVAVSGSLTGCANPNQPSGKVGDTLSFGGSSTIFGIGGASDKHTLKTAVGSNGGTLVCTFEHYPVSDATSCDNNHYQLRVVKADGTVQYFNAGSTVVHFNGDNTSSSIKKEEKVTNNLTISGLNAAGALNGVAFKEAYIQYFPRHNALGTENDAYSDVYATWDITDALKAALA